VDKKLLLSKSLAIFLKNYLQSINGIVQKYPHALVQYKPDGSPVTELDLALSSFVEGILREHFPHITFYSEEKFSDWKFPLLALDPLDGTREYILGRDEWAISVGLFEDQHFLGEGWVYNPKTGELVTEEVPGVGFQKKNHYRGEVSRSEWESGLFTGKSTRTFEIVPMGSIAYKLGRLAAGKCDFVVSLKPKSIWDIAGGSLLCMNRGMKFYCKGTEVTHVSKLYDPPLLWCHEELFPSLSEIFP
jgi:myo-inositol-1(or 4)-monophosphatase